MGRMAMRESTMRARRPAMVLMLAVAASAGGGSGASAQAAPEAATVTAEAFHTLRWLEGRWLGSGGGFDAFYESYRFVNDSTIEQATHPDETFSEADDPSTIELRDGRIFKYRRGAAESMVTRLAGDTLRFDRVPPGRGGFSWIRVSDDEWTAVLERSSGTPIVYTLRRIR